jgi:hypothetical protein
MTRTLLVLLALSAPSIALAQPAEGIGEVRTFASCIEEHQTHLERIVRLLGEVEERLGSADARVAADAQQALVTLMRRAHDIREHLRRCVEHARIPVPEGGTTVVHGDPEPDASADSVAGESGTVHVVESDVSLGAGLRVVRGERVDGTGEASDVNVRAAVRAVAPRLSACYEEFVDRVGSERGEVQLVFTVGSGGRATGVEVEVASRFDATMRSCLSRAGSEIRVADTRGRVTFSYAFRFGRD